MIRICDRYNRVQIMGHYGDVRICGWMKDGGIIGRLADDSLYDIWHSRRANEIREQLIRGDYSNCEINWCPYLAMNTIGNHMVDLDAIPEYPDRLHLAFEYGCNYQCTSCRDFRLHITDELEQGYQNIENKIKDTLPYIKVIGASGAGELFVNRHTLNILASWRPLAPKEEIRVSLESNGSLFDAEHWKQIENLGQYHLTVSITVMSFEESIYQILSGTRLPISQIESNLRFVKRLREQGVINFFEIATVYQERNFRQLPEFARRCIEEFGADYVRLRPYNARTHGSPEEDWFTDVRGKYHPYHEELKKIMQSPIMRHPKVHDWGGGRDSAMGTLEEHRRQWKSVDNKQVVIDRERKKGQLLTRLLLDGEMLTEHIRGKLSSHIVLYGIGNLGKALVKLLHGYTSIVAILDRGIHDSQYEEIPIYFSIKDCPLDFKGYDVVITPLGNFRQIREALREEGFHGALWDMEELFD